PPNPMDGCMGAHQHRCIYVVGGSVRNDAVAGVEGSQGYLIKSCCNGVLKQTRRAYFEPSVLNFSIHRLTLMVNWLVDNILRIEFINVCSSWEVTLTRQKLGSPFNIRRRQSN